jgi:hypothetical protein
MADSSASTADVRRYRLGQGRVQLHLPRDYFRDTTTTAMRARLSALRRSVRTSVNPWPRHSAAKRSA